MTNEKQDIEHTRQCKLMYYAWKLVEPTWRGSMADWIYRPIHKFGGVSPWVMMSQGRGEELYNHIRETLSVPREATPGDFGLPE